MIDFRFNFKVFLIVSTILWNLQGPSPLFAQSTIYAPIPPILKRALQYPGTLHISTFNTQTLLQLKDLPPSYKTNNQQIVKTKEGLFLFVDGTGRIYHYDPISSYWNRIDSTVFLGYNFGAYFFKMGNTFYNYGGHGLWNTTGNLRNFNPYSHEWDAKATNEYIATVKRWDNDFHYIDTAHQCLWVIGPLSDPHHVKDIYKNAPYKNTLWKLHVPSGDWTAVGKIKDTGFGTLTQFQNGFYYNGGIVDLVHNKHYKASEEMIQKIFSINSASKKDNVITYAFSIDSTIYFGNGVDRLDSLPLTSSDFIDTGIPVFTPMESNTIMDPTYLQWGVYVSLLLAGASLGWFMGRKKQPDAPTINENNPVKEETAFEVEPVPTPILHTQKTVIFKTGKDLAKLDEKEARLVQHIIQNSKEGRATSIEEINRALGVAQRNPEIQKRMRSDMINSVNQKAQLILELNGPLISKRRSSYDKRSFEYYIEDSLIPTASSL